ncbi:hypothetical protein, variant [Aphanomyces astaci]|uniref:Uncharacterized protein n=1 Tax=Aphanomyces astaci TaxID=112090 RepID=W4HCN7_APHAT|nr:hypothetical protein, variant [Aphanomyces astaci]ETV88893.1 hypothetical protein, variant [Aphanomyces astaci]|eukprot:XP_009821293.1 hypothetical protein, variant [Aphanomyces astaci]
MTRSDRDDGRGNKLDASQEPLLELTSITALPTKPKMNSGDRACLLVFCLVGLSMCYVGPTVMFTDVVSYSNSSQNHTYKWVDHEIPLNLTWHAWQDPVDAWRPSMTSQRISDFPRFPNYLYTFYSHELSTPRPSSQLMFRSESPHARVLVLEAGSAALVPTVHAGASTIGAQLNISSRSTLVLASPSVDGGISNVQLDGAALLHWTCMPGLVGEQSLIFQPTHVRSVNWTSPAGHSSSPFTWYYATFPFASSSTSTRSTARTLRMHAKGLTAGQVFFNGAHLGRYNGTSSVHFSVAVLAENTITLLEEIRANVGAVEFRLE